MLPGLKARALKHRNIIDPRDKLSPIQTNGTPCIVEETLIHYYCECPGTQGVWIQLRDKILDYTNNQNKYPPISDTEILFMGFKCDKAKMRTSMWVTATFLDKVYKTKMDKKVLVFDELWEETKVDFQVASKCRNGNLLDETIFA